MICSQCGKDVLEKACGPTHAVLTAQYKRAKELVERWMWKKKASNLPWSPEHVKEAVELVCWILIGEP